MFVYLSKKIAIPNSVRLRSVAWSNDQGWIACGGEKGLLKVLKLDMDRRTTASNLTMNQTLEGHEGALAVVGWNDLHQKLTSSDDNGLIIVWMFHKGMWFEEMINNRNKSSVQDLCWTSDGQKICIAYDDGAVIVGSVDGNRLWGRELRSGGKPLQLTHVQWSPDGKSLLFGTQSGMVHRYDAATGNSVAQLTTHCNDDASDAQLCGLEWHSDQGDTAAGDAPRPTLAVCYDNGRCQLMRHEMDDSPVLIDTGMKARKIAWDRQGQILAIAGTKPTAQSSGEFKTVAMVQFYNTAGQHIRSVKVPGTGITSLAWEGTGLRLALAVDSFIYFANVRPDYKWNYFGKTLVYAFSKPGRTEDMCVFWNMHTGEKNIVKNMSKVLSIAAAGDNCVLSRYDAASSQFVLVLCNAIGAPISTKNIDFEPTTLCMTDTHVVATGDEWVCVWQHRSITSKTDMFDPQAANARRSETKMRTFHVDDVVVGTTVPNALNMKRPHTTTDLICSSAVSAKFVFVARETGTVQVYTLPDCALASKILIPCRPHTMAVNCTSTRMSVIDIAGVMTFYDIPGKEEWSTQALPVKALGTERKDVWDMKWSADDEHLFAMMEKTRMYIFRGLEPEEPIPSAAALCAFENLQVKAVVLDEIMLNPEHPQRDCALDFDTKSLRDTRQLLDTTLEDACAFIEQHPHPRLWGLLAEKAMGVLNFPMAEKALVECQDYQGIQFLKRLKTLDNNAAKQRAEIAAYYQRFDDAERMYREMDRRDLAAELRMRLGDWFKVVQLVQEGGLDDIHIQEAWDNIGDYYAERQKWSKAVQYHSQAKSYDKLIYYYHVMEDFKGMQGLIETLPGGSPLLVELGHKFAAAGLFHDAVSSFLKADKVKLAVDTCIELNQWSQAVQLAEKFKLPEVSSYLAKYAGHLVEKGDVAQAIELYRKAEYFTDCARLLSKLGQDAGRAHDALKAKKYHVLAALNIDKYKAKMLNAQTALQQGNGMVDALLTTDQATASDRTLDSAWKGAEAYHFFLLAQEQLRQHAYERAMVTALRLTEYDDVLDEVALYSLIALAAYLGRCYSICSKAFIRLESLEARGGGKRGAGGGDAAYGKHPGGQDMFSVTLDARAHAVSSSMGALSKNIAGGTGGGHDTCYDFDEVPKPYQTLAYKIFTRHPPSDDLPTMKCWKCGAKTHEWYSSCTNCSIGFAACMASGRTIVSGTNSPEHSVEACGRCKHKMYARELSAKRWRHCPLCHALVHPTR